MDDENENVDNICNNDLTLMNADQQKINYKSVEAKEHAFCLFFSMFWVYYYPWIDKRSDELKTRYDLFHNQINKVIPVTVNERAFATQADDSDLIRISQEWSLSYAKFIAISCDDFNDKINLKVYCYDSDDSYASIELVSENEELIEVSPGKYKSNKAIALKTSEDKPIVVICPHEIGYSRVRKKCKISSGSQTVVVMLQFKWLTDEKSCLKYLKQPKLIAYYFSSVMLSLGSQYWKMLRTLHKALASLDDSVVLRSVARSLHELSIIITKKDTTNDLLSIFIKLLDDNKPEININLLENVFLFFDQLDKCQQLITMNLLLPHLDFDNDFDPQCRLKQLIAEKLCNHINALNEDEKPMIIEEIYRKACKILE